MKKITLFFLIYIQLVATDIKLLQKEKNTYKKEKQQITNKTIEKDRENKLIIISSKPIDIKDLTQRFNLHIEQCILPTVCIFKSKNTSLTQKIKEIKKSLPMLIEVKIYQTYHFKPY